MDEQTAMRIADNLSLIHSQLKQLTLAVGSLVDRLAMAEAESAVEAAEDLRDR